MQGLPNILGSLENQYKQLRETRAFCIGHPIGQTTSV